MTVEGGDSEVALLRPGTWPLMLAAASLIVLLAVVRVAQVGTELLPVLQVLYVAALLGLVIRDYPSAVGLAMVELAVAGASGAWTALPGGISGRILTLAIVFVGGLAQLALEWRRTGRLRMGHYGWHAVAIAVVLPAIWIPVGVYFGNGVGPAIQDANAYAFLAFVLVPIAVMVRGDGWRIRQWLLVACATNALITGALVMGAVAGVTPLFPMLQEALVTPEGLNMGGAIGYMPSGAGRLYLASGLYLQVGLALVVMRLLSRPAWWAWGLFWLLLIDIAATYTRGFWLAAAMVVGTVILLGAKDWRQPAKVGVATLGLLVVTSGAAVMIGASVPDYLLQRASSILATRPIDPSEPGGSGQPPVISVQPETDTDVLGEVSNEMRVVQARVLLGHIADRPLFGSGFGAVATDYPYGSIPVYELTYLDIGFKIGIVGGLLFLSFPIRLLVDALRVRFGRISGPSSIPAREAAVPFACVASVLLAAVTNPYLLAAYGLFPIIVMVAWLDPLGSEDPSG